MLHRSGGKTTNEKEKKTQSKAIRIADQCVPMLIGLLSRVDGATN